jgi:mRNA interferase MazF
MTSSTAPVRGRVYLADLGHGEKPYLIVSNNARNRQLDSSLAVRITTSPKPDMTTIVVLGANDPMAGRILCDDIIPIFRDELRRDVGALSLATMNQVAVGLRVALSS